MKRTSILLIVCWILSSGLAVADDTADDTVTKLRCGNTSITIYNSNVIESPFFVVSIFHSYGSSHYPFRVDNDFFKVRCEKSKDGKEFLLIDNVCGGSGCGDYNYALIDLHTGKEVLKPASYPGRNASKAESILGKKIKPFSCSKYSEGSSTPNDKGEYCFVSPLELD